VKLAFSKIVTCKSQCQGRERGTNVNASQKTSAGSNLFPRKHNI
jgi:hypothetical protein